MLEAEVAELYHRQYLLDVNTPETVSVIGVGGIGYYVAFNAAMLGATKIVLFDSDALDPTNRNRLPYTSEDMGKNKSQACRDMIKGIRPNCAVYAMPNLDEYNKEMLEGYVFICTDSLASQSMSRQYCAERELKFLRLGYDGRHFTIDNMADPPSLWDAGEEEPDPADVASGEVGRYTVVPSYAITPQLIALTAFLLIDMNADRGEISITANAFHIGQAMMDGVISDSVPLRFPDRKEGDPVLMTREGERVRI